MYKVGVFPGKFSPPHRGHINAILQCATKCEKLYVVVSHNSKLDKILYENTPTKPMTLKQKAKWLSIEFLDLDHIEVLMLDEDDIPVYPYGWKQWSNKLTNIVPEKIDVIFGGETEYKDEGYSTYFPYAKYELFDTTRTQYSISATEIRNNPYKHWEYILGSAREHFVKKFLIVGTESCGKSTLTKVLSKIYFTSWAREEGRYYSTKYLGGNEKVFEPEDFYNICWEQRQLEEHAVKTANRITFLDTDATITQFYCKMYLGEYNPKIETLIDSSRYDYLLMMKPDVKWVPDGFRWNNEDEKRWRLHNELKQMYVDRGFGDKIIEIGGDYNKRLNQALDIVNEAIKCYI